MIGSIFKPRFLVSSMYQITEFISRNTDLLAPSITLNGSWSALTILGLKCFTRNSSIQYHTEMISGLQWTHFLHHPWASWLKTLVHLKFWNLNFHNSFSIHFLYVLKQVQLSQPCLLFVFTAPDLIRHVVLQLIHYFSHQPILLQQFHDLIYCCWVDWITRLWSTYSAIFTTHFSFFI